MKKCNTELMKELKAVQADLAELIADASNKNTVSYYEGEEEVERDFDYKKFVDKMTDLREQERRIKTLLAYSNATTKLVGMEELTIGEGLLKLAQLNNQLRTIAGYKTRKQVVKNVKHATFEGDKDRVFVTEHLHDPAQVDTDIKALQREISQLQVAIDRTNLTNMIEC